ncbi:MAG TPA: 30S ribosomal protein S21 [Patescibacteria group bacterium]
MSVSVKAQPGESAESLLRKFNRRVQVEGIIPEARKRERYLKPSAKRKMEAQERRKKFKRW